MKYSATALATLSVLLVLWQFKWVLLLFVFSLFVAATIRPYVEGLVARGLPKGVAQLLLYVVGIGGLLLLLLLVGDLLLAELNTAANRAVIAYEALLRRWEGGMAWQQTAVEMLPAPYPYIEEPENELGQMLPVIVTATQNVAAALGGLLLLLVLSVYWSVDQYRFERLWLSLLPAQRRTFARDSWRNMETAVSGYLHSQFMQSLLAGVFLGVGAALMGVEFPLLFAFWGALAAFVPLLGGLITAVAAFFLGSMESPWIGLGLAAYTLVVFGGLELFIEPRIWRRKRRSLLLSVFMILLLFEAFGLWGLIAAPPLAAILEGLIKQTYQAVRSQRETAVQLTDLEKRFQQLAQKAEPSENGQPPPEIKNLIERLDQLLVRSRQVKT
ncbi:MAG: AI-2E family transporter [Chloroflexota bacterium]